MAGRSVETTDTSGLPAEVAVAWGVRERPHKGPKPALSLPRIVERAWTAEDSYLVFFRTVDGAAGVIESVAADRGPMLFTTRVGAVILAESGLAFLGLGVPPPAPTWGGMLSGSGRSFMYLAPWLALAPGLCITVVVYAINVFGDALRDLLDPRMRGSR